MPLRRRAAHALSTWFGCGRSPVAPGTVGSLGAVPLHLVLRLLPLPLHAAAVVAMAGLAVWAANEAARESGEEDPQWIVVDEVAGVLVAMGLVRGIGTGAEITAWALFRVLDIAKPGPVRSAERLKPAGLGIVADDLLAGLAAGALVRCLAH
jgi:phosphatidylglycerophosphatase A